jgi:hypothetical protein
MELQKLDERIKMNGVGIQNLHASLVKRTDDKAWYIRDDNVHEVFKIKIEEKQEVFGKTYPRRERYPGNEDFGQWAWCFRKEENARYKYNNI